MKKFLALLLTMTMIFAFVACQGDATSENNVDKTPEATEVATPEATQEATPEVTPEATPEVTPEATPEATPEVTKQPEANSNNVFFNPNNSNYDVDALSIKPRYVYWENGYLVAECFVINGFNHNVFNINVKSLSFNNGAGPIVSAASFGALENVTLPPYTNIVWTFRFAPDTVVNYGADLSRLICDANVSNSY